MKKRDQIALSIFAIFYVGFGFFLYINQERIIYRPFPQDFARCPNFAATERVTTNGTRMYVSETNEPVVVLYHGNAGSACDRSFYANLFAQAGYGFAIVEYAGYSNDIRQTTHDLIKADVRNVITYFENEGRVIAGVVGESIGTGPATYHATIAPPAQLLLITPFTDLTALAQDRFWFYPAGWLVDNAFDNVANLEQYEGRVGIIHGTDDGVIPYRLGQELYETINSEKTLFRIEGADHNDLFSYTETTAALLSFLGN